MPEIDFTVEYMPATADIPVEQLQDTATRMKAYADDAFPDIANTPGSALGDLVSNPQAHIVAAVEEGVSRVESDLRLENVAGGTAYNCDFVQAYLENMGVRQSLTLPSSGTVRLTFSEDRHYTLDRSVQFRFGEAVYSMYLPYNGPMEIVPTTEEAHEGINHTRLHGTDGTAWYCDIPVIGENGDIDIPAASQAEVNIMPPIPQLAGAVALHTFLDGHNEASLPDLARRAQETFHAATLNTRNGAIQYVRSECPFAESVYAVHNGDRELIRHLRNGYGTAAGCMDVYARSKAYEFTEEQLVKLVYNETPDNDGKTWFEGYWDYTGIPYHLESVTHDSLPSMDQLPHRILSMNSLDLGALVSYTTAERLYLKVENLVQDGETVYETFKEPGNDETYALFRVRYQTDPMLPAIAQTVENDDNIPVNASIRARGFIPVIISQFTVVYVRKPGVVPDLDTAADKIRIYLASVGVPDSYTDAEISRIMGEAGVRYVKRVLVQARVQWTLADKVLSYGETVDMDDPGAEGVMEDVPAFPYIRDSDGLRITYPNKGVPITADMMYSCSPRNIRYFLLEGALGFKEVVDA